MPRTINETIIQGWLTIDALNTEHLALGYWILSNPRKWCGQQNCSVHLWICKRISQCSNYRDSVKRYIVRPKSNCLTFDRFIKWVNKAPEITAIFAFFYVVAQNIGTSRVSGCCPCQINAVFESANNFWHWRWPRECWKGNQDRKWDTSPWLFSAYNSENAHPLSLPGCHQSPSCRWHHNQFLLWCGSSIYGRDPHRHPCIWALGRSFQVSSSCFCQFAAVPRCN